MGVREATVFFCIARNNGWWRAVDIRRWSVIVVHETRSRHPPSSSNSLHRASNCVESFIQSFYSQLPSGQGYAARRSTKIGRIPWNDLVSRVWCCGHHRLLRNRWSPSRRPTRFRARPLSIQQDTLCNFPFLYNVTSIDWGLKCDAMWPHLCTGISEWPILNQNHWYQINFRID